MICTCGKNLNECPFWSSVYADIPLKGHLKVYRRKLDLILGRHRYFDHDGHLIDPREYLALNEKIYENIYRESGGKAIFDSSKYPNRAELLLKSDKLKLVFVHLVRDGRGVVWSLKKRYGGFWRAMFYWAKLNLSIDMISRRNDVDYVFVRYEELVRNPERVLDAILRRVGLSFEPGILDYRSKEHHQADGNELRLDLTNNKIKEDLAWKENLTWLEKSVFAVFFGWLNLYYRLRKSV